MGGSAGCRVPAEDGHVVFREPEPGPFTAWAPFAADTDYFGSTGHAFTVNLRVVGLDATLDRLRAPGARLDPGIHEDEYGRFAWFVDPDGSRVEPWEPPGA